jgi:hypothetical protein
LGLGLSTAAGWQRGASIGHAEAGEKKGQGMAKNFRIISHAAVALKTADQ